MEITDEIALQAQTWFLTAFVEKTWEQLNRNISPEAALGAQVLKALHLNINISTSSHPLLLAVGVVGRMTQKTGRPLLIENCSVVCGKWHG